MSKSENAKNIEMQVLGNNGYEVIYPIPANHASSHGIGMEDGNKKIFTINF